MSHKPVSAMRPTDSNSTAGTYMYTRTIGTVPSIYDDCWNLRFPDENHEDLCAECGKSVDRPNGGDDEVVVIQRSDREFEELEKEGRLDTSEAVHIFHRACFNGRFQCQIPAFDEIKKRRW